jgi:uncharacterized protein (DUF58 family)
MTLNGGVIALAIPLVIYLGAAFLYGPRQTALSATRTLSAGCVSPGTAVTVKLSVVNQGPQLEELVVEDFIPSSLELVEGETRRLAPLPPGGTIELSYTVRGKRGSFAFRDVQVTASDHLGLFQKQMRLPAPAHLLIKPETLRLRPVAIRPLRTHGFAGPFPARQAGSGVNFFGVREYQLGDPLRRINWKVAARRDRTLFTNEFEQERVADVGLILDGRWQTDVQSPSGPLFEHAIRATAGLAETFLRDGNRVGLLIYGRGREMVFPGYGKVQRERILRALAQARTGDSLALENLDYLPTRFFPTHSQIILVSPLSPNDPAVLIRLRAHGYRLLVISPDPVDFRAKTLKPQPALELAVRIAAAERVLLLRRLQRVGIQIVDWQVDQSLDHALRMALGRVPKEFRVMGIGL